MTNIIRVSRKIILTILILNVIFAIVNVSQAFSLSSIIESGSDFLSTGEAESYKFHNADEVKSIINNIYSILFPLAVAITVIVGGVLGIKFMMASAEDKAKIKEMLIPYVIGCVVIYGAIGIWKLVVNIGDSLLVGSGFNSQEEKLEAWEDIYSGQTDDLSKYTNKQIIELYEDYQIAETIKSRTTKHSTLNPNPLTVEQAINQLGTAQKLVYNEAKKRGLIHSNGYTLLSY